MKKKIIIISIIVVALILLVPVPRYFNDGGSVEYRALLYSITKYHELVTDLEGNTGFKDGIGIEVLGMQIYNNTEVVINDPAEQENSFFATVIESKTEYIVVEPREDEEERQASDKFYIGLGKYNDAIYEVGTNLKITYKGAIMTTYPAQINVTKIEIKSADNFSLKFYNQAAESSVGIKFILSKEETEKYNYNIYSYKGEVNIVINDKEMPLRDALLENKITMEEIIAKANNDEKEGKIKTVKYLDGGSMEYYYENYTIIKCHNLYGNRDVYIGVPEMKLNNIRAVSK